MSSAGTSNDKSEGVSFEEAIAKTGGGGWFQTRLLLITLSLGLTFSIGVSSVAYVMPSIICQFSITKYQQGLMYSAIYLGMVPFGAVWGAATDILGRRITLIITTGIAGTFEFLSAFSNGYWMLFFCKFFAGCATSGVHLTYYIYLSEFVDAQYKDVMTVRTGGAAAFGYFILPAIAIFLCPAKFSIPVIPGILELNGWKSFLMISSLAPIVSFFVSIFCLSETPKYLLLQNRKEESLQILKDIYSTNTKQPRDTFPIRSLSIEDNLDSKTKNGDGASRSGFVNYIRPLFQYPYFIPAMMSFAAQLITMGSYNTIRQHIPTLFSVALGIGQTSSIYKHPERVEFCILFQSQELFTSKVNCTGTGVNTDENEKVYPYTTIVGFAIFLSFFFFQFAVAKIGKVRTFLFAHVASAAVMSYYPYCIAISAVAVMTIYSCCMQNCLTIALGLMIGRVPANMRGLTISLIMVVGRVGVILGNQVLPILTNISCYFGFWTIACINLMAIPIMFVYHRQPNPYEDATMEASAKKR